MAERSYDIGAFEAIRLAGHHEVIVTTGTPEAIRAEGDEETLANLELNASKGTLTIGNRRRGWLGARRQRGSLTIHVGIPELRSAAIAGSGEIRVNRISGQSFAGAIAGSGEIRIDDMQVDDARFSIAGSGDVKAAGRAARAGMSIAGSGDGDLSALVTDEIDISIKGSGDIAAHATGTARISVKGSGDVDLTGGANCTIRQSGSGNVRCH